MNTPSTRPRLVCRAARLWGAVAASRHAESCAACRAYFSSVETLEQALRRAAPAMVAATPEPRPGFEPRLRRLAQPAARPARASVSPRWWIATLATGAAAALAIVVSTRSAAERATQADAALLAVAVENASRSLVETVIPSTGALVADNPLQREFTAIRTDARSALSFLALNFLPGDAMADASFSPAWPF